MKGGNKHCDKKEEGEGGSGKENVLMMRSNYQSQVT